MSRSATTTDIIFEGTAETAVEFLDWISPRGQFFMEAEPYDWLFRGQNLESLRLIPGGLREENCERLLRSSRADLRSASDITARQVLAEINLLCEFVNASNDSGLAIPGVSAPELSQLEQIGLAFDDLGEGARTTQARAISADELVETLRGSALGELWPPAGLLPALTLARHHGLLTRLLDWSYSSSVAAYFAASSVVAKIHRDGEIDSAQHLSVSALNRSAIGAFPVPGSDTRRGDICIVAVPHEPNRNLLAQFGALTITPVPADELPSPTDRRPIDELLLANKEYFLERVEKHAKRAANSRRAPLMYHFKLPRAEAPKLLWLLLKEHVSYHQMFPNYEGVVRSMDETVRLLQLRDRGVW